MRMPFGYLNVHPNNGPIPVLTLQGQALHIDAFFLMGDSAFLIINSPVKLKIHLNFILAVRKFPKQLGPGLTPQGKGLSSIVPLGQRLSSLPPLNQIIQIRDDRGYSIGPKIHLILVLLLYISG
ncbi:hypothetical protein D3C81_1255860 [compost metagenome]